MLNFLDLSSLAAFVLKTMPLPVMVVNSEVRVRGMNEAAVKFLCISKEDAALKKCGDVLKCVNARHPKGCGGSPRCIKCVLRKSVLEALQGRAVSRNKGYFDIIDNGELKRVTLLVTAAPIQCEDSQMAIVLTEDVSLVTQIEGLIPICSVCHRICDENGKWTSLETYLQGHSEAELTHEYCPECNEKTRADTIRALTDK